VEGEFLPSYAALRVDRHVYELAVHARQALESTLESSNAPARCGTPRRGHPAGILVLVDHCPVVRGRHSLHLFGAKAGYLSAGCPQIGERLTEEPAGVSSSDTETLNPGASSET
jgi:hypothetical protein